MTVGRPPYLTRKIELNRLTPFTSGPLSKLCFLPVHRRMTRRDTHVLKVRCASHYPFFSPSNNMLVLKAVH
jgi:hypothetical protein